MAKPKSGKSEVDLIPVQITIRPDILAMPRGPERKAEFDRWWRGYELRYGLKDENPAYEFLKIENGSVYLIRKG